MQDGGAGDDLIVGDVLKSFTALDVTQDKYMMWGIQVCAGWCWSEECALLVASRQLQCGA